MGDFIHDVLHSIINHFIPHEGNDFRPHLLQKAAVVGMMMMVVLTFTLANFQALLWQSSAWLVGAVLPAVVIDLTNAERVENSLPTLVRNPVLDAAANLKAADMAKRSYFSHDSPTGVTPWHWFAEAGYSYVYAGENLAVYFTDSSAVVDAWMQSPTHRANIVGSQYREIGVGTAKGVYEGYDTIFVVQLFGTPGIPAPLALPVVSQVAPVTTPPVVVAVVEPPAVVNEESAIPVVQEPQVAGEESVVPEPSLDPYQPTAEAETESRQMSMPNLIPASPNEPVAQVPEPMPVTPVITDDVVGMQSNMAFSETNLAPAPFMSVDSKLQTTVPPVAKLATQPHQVLQTVYLILGIVTLLVLFASILIEWRQHRPVQTVYGIALLILMCGLFYLHSTLTAGVLVG